MSEIRLQDYSAKIKDLIRDDLHDEAIAHCQHILRHYPRHVETYCLLGEACLEKGMYREAIEFFQRTLSADPESFIARVGMGIIYDEQGALAEAIWQMERAFELAPGNAEVRRELQRLYAQRDGVEKTRLKLTRGALGRLYMRNGIYERAISEFRAVLRQDPELPSIRVALVESLWREGRRLEAVETCLDLLEALPNCLKANLILGEIWMRGGHEDAGEEKLNVARSLDPESLVAQEMMGRDSPLPYEEILISELSVTADMLDLLALGAEEPEEDDAPWLVEPEEAEAEDALPLLAVEGWDTPGEIPDWLRDMDLGEVRESETPPPGALAAEAEPTQAPDWLRELTGEAEILGVTEPIEEDEPHEQVLAAEIPDWLQEIGMAAEEPVESEQLRPDIEEVEDEIEPAAEIPEWLRELEPLEEEQIPLTSFEGPPVEQLPEWLRELEATEDVGPMAIIGEREDEGAIRAEELPEWLRDLEAPIAEVEVEEPVAEVEPAEELPEWLRDLEAPIAEVEAEEPAPLEVEEPVAEVEPAEELPEWLRDLEAPIAEVEVEEPAPLEVEAPVAEVAVPESLRALVEAGILDEADLAAAMAEMSPEDLEVQRAEAVPDWLQDLMGEEVPEPEAAVVVPLVEEVAVEAPIAEVEAEEPALLEVEEPVAEAEPAEELPEWLRDLAAPIAEVEAEEPAPLEVEAPALLEVEEPVAEVEPAEELPEWLRDLAAPTAEVEVEEPALLEVEAPVAEVEPAEELPEWLRDLEAPIAEVGGPALERGRADGRRAARVAARPGGAHRRGGGGGTRPAGGRGARRRSGACRGAARVAARPGGAHR